ASAAGGTPEPRGGEPRGGQARCGEPPRALAVLINLFDFGVTLSAAALLVKDQPAFSINDAVLRLDPHFEVKAYAFGGTASLPRALTDFREDLRIRGFTESVIGACFAGVDNFFLLQLREGADRDELFLPDVRAPLKGFDSVLLRRVVLERCLAPGGAALEIGYCWGAEEAVAAVRTGRCRAAFFLNPPNKRKLVQLARAGLRLPPSSARLEPPVRKGLVKMRVAARSAP
ncbi:MAG: DUF1015 family protein, partial [Planctomycetes bacterium]|nr:DUF1015 family protein [Planctomycetota bacterium]